MSNDGRNLEVLVKKIEKSLVGEGFSVEANQRSFEGKLLVGEFDLVISGKVGSIPVRYLFECRDRPSDGPQGREWIQQILGRKADFKFNGAVAVSTTGFSEAAINLAKREGVALRTVRTTDEIAEGIKLVSFVLANPEITPCGRINIIPMDLKDDTLGRGKVEFSYSTTKFRELTSWQTKSFFHFALDNLPKDFDQQSNGTRYCDLQIHKPVAIHVDGKVFVAKEIWARICFQKGRIKGKTIALRSYDSESGLLGQEVSVLFNSPIGTIKTDLTFAFKDDRIALDVIDVEWPGAKCDTLVIEARSTNKSAQERKGSTP